MMYDVIEARERGMGMRILVVEDEKNLARSLVQLLESQKYQVEAVFTGDDGLAYAQSGQYDALVLDVMLPGLSGFQIASALRKAGDATPILMLTAREDVEDKVKGLDSGADDYLTKPFTTQELLARVRALLRRQGPVQRDEVTFSDLSLSVSNGILKSGDKQVRLSKKELDVMTLLMNRAGGIISKNELISRVWGADSEAVDNNVEAYISFLRKKLFFLGSRTQITSQRRLGYTLEDA